MTEILPEDSVRFGLKDMLIATTVFSIALAVFKLTGLVGAFLSFLTAVCFSIFIYKRPLPAAPETRAAAIGQRRILKDFIWGICMPIVCLVFDPVFFREPGGELLQVHRSLNEIGFIALPLLVLQLIAMLVWLSFGWTLRRWGGVFAGIFAVGAAAAFLIGLCMLPFACIGTLMLGLGLMGLTPWLTGYAYLRRLRRAFALGKRCQSTRWFRISLAGGALAAIALPLLFTGLVFGPDKLQILTLELFSW